MSENAKDFILNCVVSGIIGLIVGLAGVAIGSSDDGVAFSLIYASVLGVFIGTVSRFWVIHLYFRKKKSMKTTLMVVFATIGLITISPSVYYSLSVQQSFFTGELMVSLLIAEALGIGFCHASIKSAIDLNEKLEHKKREMMRKIN